MEIRKATLADADVLTDLLAQLGYPETGGFIPEKIGALTRHPDAELLVAVDGDAVVGFISIHFIPQVGLAGSFARISYLCIDEKARGRGVGALLTATCERLARDRACNRIEVHSHSRRTGAHAFYARCGFEESPKYLIKSLIEDH